MNFRYIQVGNAVAVPVARALGYSLALSSRGLVGEEPVFSLPNKFPNIGDIPAEVSPWDKTQFIIACTDCSGRFRWKNLHLIVWLYYLLSETSSFVKLAVTIFNGQTISPFHTFYPEIQSEQLFITFLFHSHPLSSPQDMLWTIFFIFFKSGKYR